MVSREGQRDRRSATSRESVEDGAKGHGGSLRRATKSVFVNGSKAGFAADSGIDRDSSAIDAGSPLVVRPRCFAADPRHLAD